MARPVVLAANGLGVAVTEAVFGEPVIIADNGLGAPIVLVASGGIPVTFIGGSPIPPGFSILTDPSDGAYLTDPSDGAWILVPST